MIPDRMRISGKLPEGTIVFDTYWRFAVERQRMLFRRLRGDMMLTTDAILEKYRFTNAYRALDRVSQYLLARIVPQSERTREDLFFRILLFKIFNKIETWEALVGAVGEPHWGEVSLIRIVEVLHSVQRAKQAVYSAAYIMPSPSLGGRSKAENHVRLLEQLMHSELPRKWGETRSLGELYRLLVNVPSFGPFLAFQYAIDLNYSDLVPHDEGTFVVAGPGARSGIAKCFPNSADTAENVILAVTRAQKEHFDVRGLDFPDLWGRPLQPIDCQNLFCEVDKYSRIHHPEFAGSGRTRIKQAYRRSSRVVSPYVFPQSWNIARANQHVDVPYVF